MSKPGLELDVSAFEPQRTQRISQRNAKESFSQRPLRKILVVYDPRPELRSRVLSFDTELLIGGTTGERGDIVCEA